MIRIKNKWGRKVLVIILMLCLTVSVLASCRDDDNVQSNPTEALTENSTRPPTEDVSKGETENPAEPPTQGGTEAPTEPPTQGGTEAPTEPPTQGGTEAPTEPPTQGGTEAPTEPPTQGGTEAPTEPPTQGGTEAPTESPTQGGTEAPTESPTQGGTEAPTQDNVENPTEPQDPPKECEHEYDNACDASCNKCGEGRIPEPHKEVVLSGADETCTLPGKTQGIKCSVCGYVIKAQQQIPAKGHIEAVEYGYDATCTESGLTDGIKCTVCGEFTQKQIILPALGHKEEIIPAVGATCTTLGSTEGIKCSVCSEMLEAPEEIPAIGHAYENGVCENCGDGCDHVGGEASCTARAVCDSCGKEYGELLPHKYGEYSIKTPATCTADAIEEAKCTNCDAVTQRTVENSMLSHTEKILQRVDATCTASGKTEGAECEVCGFVIRKQEIILSNGHDYVVVEGTPPTCTENGYTAGLECSVCGEVETEQEIIPSKGHKYENGVCENCGDGCDHVGGEASCTARAVCDSCGKEYGELLPHEYGEYSIKIPATCTADAIEEAKCTNCDAVTQRTVENSMCTADAIEEAKCTNCDAVTQRTVENSMLPHTEKILQKVDATCTASGKTEGAECEVCGYIIVAQTEISAKGHKWLDADCTTPKTCSVCGETDGEPYGHMWDEANCREPKRCHLCNITEGDPLGHTEEVMGENKAPTCTEEGSVAGIRCSVCWAQIEAVEKIPAKGHTEAVEYGYDATCTESGLTDGIKCTVCGEFTQKQIILPALGHKEEIIPAVGATCTTLGSTEGIKCSVCSEMLEAPEEIPAIGHAYENGVCENCGYGCDHVGGESTCTEPAVCENCGMKYGELLPHEYGEYSIKIPATCTADAIEEAKCTNCDAVTQRTVENSMLPHTEKILQKVDATCTASGKTEGAECEVCGYIIVTQTEIPATGHVHEIVSGKAPTCTEDGLTDGLKCSVCGYIETEQAVIPATGHTAETVLGYAATCGASGLTDGSKCTICEEILVSQQEIPATNSHDYQIFTKVEPTCNTSGLTSGTVCKVCGYVGRAQEVIPATGAHDYNVLVKVDATCTESGLTSGTVCKVCGYVGKAQEEIPPNGHTEVIIPAVEATCTSSGNTQGVKCSECGEILTSTTVIPANAHTNINVPAVQPTCTSEGLTAGVKCSVCGVFTTPQEIVAKSNHVASSTYQNNDTHHWTTCETCGVTMQKGAHRYSEGECSVCRFEEIVIETCPKEEYSGGYKHAFDYLMLDSVVIAGAGTSTPVDSCGALDVFKGQEVRLQGWIGFPNGDITAFGYYFDYGVNATVINDAFKQSAESGVVQAGGQYRFSIGADTATLSAGTHTVTFVAVMSDETYVIMKSIKIVIPNTDVNIPEGEIVKAEKEELGAVNMTMTATGNTNEYTTPAGLTFTANATGMTFSDGRFGFSSSHNLKINFADYAQRFATDFNRYKIAYSSSAPLKVIVSYTENGIATTDTVYLEAGDNMLFNCLTVGYLNGRYSKYITSLDIKMLGDSSTATFVLYNVSTESIDIIGSNSLTYLRNERYILGIKLAWGGGISYLKDNLDNNTSIGNLINDADTGRLVQQSYYGTKDTSEYQPGTYNGTVWNYNPVQGGNLSNGPSRIIDLEINDFSVYIKAQPQDWAKTEITPSYMENVYTLYPNRIQVDNRFVDFAGFKTNPARHQELPAFYTIGYLNTFKFYNGTSPWTGGALQSEESLAFWGDRTNGNDPYFELKKGNTETWCAWVNKDSNYGLGLYTPNIDVLLAGRHAYDLYPDATASNSSACSYVAPLNSFKIVSYKALEYSYLITSGSTEEIRALFKTYKDFASNASLTSSAFGYKSGRV